MNQFILAMLLETVIHVCSELVLMCDLHVAMRGPYLVHCNFFYAYTHCHQVIGGHMQCEASSQL